MFGGRPGSSSVLDTAYANRIPCPAWVVVGSSCPRDWAASRTVCARDTYRGLKPLRLPLQEEFNAILKDYVGRPSPLYHAERLSEQYRRYAFAWRRVGTCCGGSKQLGGVSHARSLVERQGDACFEV